MRRALAFLVFGPVLAAAGAMVVVTQAAQPDRGSAQILAAAVFLFTLPVSAITGCIDGVLNDLPVPLRAALSAAAGALVAFGLALVLFSWILAPPAWLYFAFGGATCMGACSLLASELCHRVSAMQEKSLLRN